MKNEKTNIGIDEILNEVETLQNAIDRDKENKGLFKVRTANKWIEQAKTRPIPKMLFGECITGLFKTNKPIIFKGDINLKKHLVLFKFSNSMSNLTVYYFKNFFKKDVSTLLKQFTEVQA